MSTSRQHVEFGSETAYRLDVFDEFGDQVNNEPSIAAALEWAIEDEPGFASPNLLPHLPPNSLDGVKEQANDSNIADMNALPDTQPPQAGNHPG